MNLGMKHSSTELAQPAKTQEAPQIIYPTVTIEKKIGSYEFGDEFTATVKFRVREVSEGKSYSGDTPRHRCTLEMISLDPIKKKGQGLPHGNY